MILFYLLFKEIFNCYRSNYINRHQLQATYSSRQAVVSCECVYYCLLFACNSRRNLIRREARQGNFVSVV